MQMNKEKVKVRRQRYPQQCQAPQRLHLLLHDHVSQGVAERVVLVMQHKCDTVSVCPVCLNLSQTGKEEML